MSSDILKPPAYCQTAIATDAGWVNPKTGELLVIVRNLRQRIAEQALAVEFKREDVKSETERVLEQITNAIVAEQSVDVVQEITVQEETDEPIEQQTSSITVTKVDNNITLSIEESTEVAEAVAKPKRPGRPKKQKANEQSE